MDEARRDAKRRGREAANEWLKKCKQQERIDVAACELEYGETLDGLRRDGYKVPPSPDVDFSLGFFKQVKSRTHNALWRES